MKPSIALAKNRSDKVAHYPYGHEYGDFYDELFSQFKEPMNILEIGVLRGESVKAWREAFPNSNITCIDLFDPHLPTSYEIDFVHADVKNVTLIGKYDVIIDDSSHDLKESLYEIQNFCENLTEQGVLIIEDIQIPSLYLNEMLKVLPKGFKLQQYDFRHFSGGQKHDDFIVKISRA